MRMRILADRGRVAMAARERPDSSDKEAVFEYSDQLYKEEKWKELFEYLQEVLGSGDDPELAWRFLRSGYRYGKQAHDAGDNSEAERIVDITMERGGKVVEKNDRHLNLHRVRRPRVCTITTLEFGRISTL